MTWFTAGTIAIVSGSDAVAGTDTAWSAQQILPGFALFTAAGVLLGEIETVNSPTSLTLVNPIAAAGASGIGYMIVPTRGSDIQIYEALSQLIADYASVRDNAGQGMFGDGSAATPGIRFAGDQDTGLWRPSPNVIAIAAGGGDVFRGDGSGNAMFNTNTPVGKVTMRGRETEASSLATSAANSALFLMGYNGSTWGLAFGSATGSIHYVQSVSAAGDAARTLSLNPYGGNVGIGHVSASEKLTITSNTGTAGLESTLSLTNLVDSNLFIRVSGSAASDKRVQIGPTTNTAITFATQDVERARISGAGNLLVGVTSGTNHILGKTGTVGTTIAQITNAGVFVSAEYSVVDSMSLGSSSASAMRVGWNLTTGRSINAPGTINASGADFAEYITKAPNCGTIANGDVCGVDADGQLVTSWAAAHSFVIKSLEPGFVGGDKWWIAAGVRPQMPAPIGTAPVAPIAPEPFTDPEPVQGEEESEAAFAVRLYIWGQASDAAGAAKEAYDEAVAAFPALLSAWESASATHAVDLAQYEVDLAAWEAALEAERVKVDRIAFCGQVPANLTGPFEVGDYVLPVEGDGDTITAIALAENSITFEQYRRRIGKIWAIREGRAWIDVQHG